MKSRTRNACFFAPFDLGFLPELLFLSQRMTNYSRIIDSKRQFWLISAIARSLLTLLRTGDRPDGLLRSLQWVVPHQVHEHGTEAVWANQNPDVAVQGLPPDLISAEGGRRADVKLAKERPFSERSTETGSSGFMDHKVSCKMFHTPSFALADEFLLQSWCESKPTRLKDVIFAIIASRRDVGRLE